MLSHMISPDSIDQASVQDEDHATTHTIRQKVVTAMAFGDEHTWEDFSSWVRFDLVHT
jgi:hypothetical protein